MNQISVSLLGAFLVILGGPASEGPMPEATDEDFCGECENDTYPFGECESTCDYENWESEDDCVCHKCVTLTPQQCEVNGDPRQNPHSTYPEVEWKPWWWEQCQEIQHLECRDCDPFSLPEADPLEAVPHTFQASLLKLEELHPTGSEVREDGLILIWRRAGAGPDRLVASIPSGR